MFFKKRKIINNLIAVKIIHLQKQFIENQISIEKYCFLRKKISEEIDLLYRKDI